MYFEEAGKMEDRAILGYMESLKSCGMPFAGSADAGYESLGPADFARTIRGKPNRVTKKVPMIQLADLVLYAMAKGGYDESYAPFCKLHECRKIIDALIPAESIPKLGVKYSCFDTKKARVEPSL